jgi:hypothetical protein
MRTSDWIRTRFERGASNFKLLELRTLGQLRNQPTRLTTTASPGLGLVVRAMALSSFVGRVTGSLRDIQQFSDAARHTTS